MKPRLSKSCTSCQQQKRKCDGGKPCKRCTRRGCECTYVAAQKRGPKRKRKRSAQTAADGPGSGSDGQGEVATAANGELSLAALALSDIDLGSLELPIADLLAETTGGETSPTAWLASLLCESGADGTTPTTSDEGDTLSTEATGQLFGRDDSAASTVFGLHNAQHAVPAHFMTDGALSNGLDANIRAAALGIDLDAVLATYFTWFCQFAPVFSEQELRMYISLNEAPDHVLFALAALSATYTPTPRSRLYHSDALTPQASLFAAKAQESLLPRLERLVAPTIFEAYSLLLLGLQFTFRGRRFAGLSYDAQAWQVMDALTSSVDTAAAPSSPLARHVSIMFWSLWLLDRTSVQYATGRSTTISFGSNARTPPLPDLPTSPRSPFDATVVFASYIRIMNITTRVVVWFRESMDDKCLRHARMESLGLMPPPPSETMQTLTASLTAFVSASAFPASYVVTDPDVDLAPVLCSMSPAEVYFWVTTNMLYRACTLYFDMAVRRKWYTVELLTKVAGQASLHGSSFAVRLACETADSLIRDGHVSPSSRCVPPSSASTTSLAPSPGCPTLEQVVSWYEDILATKTQGFWWAREDVAKVRAIVNGWCEAL